MDNDRAQKPFKRVALISRHNNSAITETLTALVKYLDDVEVDLVVDAQTAQHFPSQALPAVPAEQLSEYCDLLLVVGGDGSLLQAAHIAIEQDLPILGINRGRLGFLTDILPDHLNQVAEVLAGKYQEEQRFLLTSRITSYEPSASPPLRSSEKGVSENSNYLENDALNDIVLMRGDVARMLEFDIYINEQFMCNQRADGLIIATPTGSTAYALSGGGPILHPKLDAIVILPMFPHTLTSRPIVIDADSMIDIAISPQDETLPMLAHDGRLHVPVSAKDQVSIRKKTRGLRLIHPMDYNYFQTLQSKLYWERKNNVLNSTLPPQQS